MSRHIELYDYQQACLDQIRDAYRNKKRRPLLVAPCGAGKTVMFSAICKGAVDKGSTVHIYVHRQELIDQVSETLENFNVAHGIISPQFNYLGREPVQVVSVFTLARRLERVPAPDLIIIDEAHHAIPNSTWGKIIKHYDRARLLGVTATPIRLSGQGLGDTFDTMVLGPSTETLVESGRLAPLDVFAPPFIDTRNLKTRMGEFVQAEAEAAADRPSVTGNAIEHYHRHAFGKRSAVFCVSLNHASHLASQANASGISAVMIDGKMDKSLRREVVRDFAADKIRWLVSVDLISEGFDCPGIEVGISLRPTHSLGLWRQQCGRILRVHPGKDRALLLDHAGNTLRHGLPTEDPAWSLSGSGAARKGDGARGLSVRVCPKCFAASNSVGAACSSCGYAFAVKSRVIAHKKGDLEKITPEILAARKAAQEKGRTKTRDGLIALGTLRKYKSPERWADHVMGARKFKRTVKT